MMRKQIAAANWKMNLTLAEGQALAAALVAAVPSVADHRQVILAVPFPYLAAVQELLANAPGYAVAAQNCHHKKSGAYTGEVSGAMLTSMGVGYVIIGHSERREYAHEDHAVLAEKVNLCLATGLRPVFCCGEPLAIREAGTENAFTETQLRESLFHLNEAEMRNFIIAYEPIWAIGTGKTATSEQAQEMHAHIRRVLAGQYGESIANSVSILYGGSVKAANAGEIFGKPDVDGGLVGGASLVAEEFTAIINSLK
jgi:triosephosphate isomerase (TIM)